MMKSVVIIGDSGLALHLVELLRRHRLVVLLLSSKVNGRIPFLEVKACRYTQPAILEAIGDCEVDTVIDVLSTSHLQESLEIAKVCKKLNVRLGLTGFCDTQFSEEEARDWRDTLRAQLCEDRVDHCFYHIGVTLPANAPDEAIDIDVHSRTMFLPRRQYLRRAVVMVTHRDIAYAVCRHIQYARRRGRWNLIEGGIKGSRSASWSRILAIAESVVRGRIEVTISNAAAEHSNPASLHTQLDSDMHICPDFQASLSKLLNLQNEPLEDCLIRHWIPKWRYMFDGGDDRKVESVEEYLRVLQMAEKGRHIGHGIWTCIAI